MDKPWSGRFKGETDALVEAFTQSVSFDKRLWHEDIEGSIAHVTMLACCGIISTEEAGIIVNGLKEIALDIENGKFLFDPKLEDVHMNIETELTRRIGDAGKKLHTGRSRNDQVALDLRLHVKKGLKEINEALNGFMKAIVEKAAEHIDDIIPGMTHMQFAQPVSFAHHLLAYFEMVLRDTRRIGDSIMRLNEASPLGAAALAGTPHPIDRFITAARLGFDWPARNSMDAVSDRDFALDAVYACSMVMMHLSRLAEEVIIWNSQVYGLIELPDSYTTGSSIMPQKKNPDVAELVRGKTGRIYGNLINLLTIMKGLPLAYNRDMQEDKLPLFDSIDTTLSSVIVMTGLIKGLTLKVESAKAVLEKGFITATDIADYLASKGMPFRDAHHITGKIVSWLISVKKTISDMKLEDYRGFSETFGEDVLEYVKPSSSVDRRKSFGGTARDNVRDAIKKALHTLDGMKG
jgi:argininosuccinate lyase